MEVDIDNQYLTSLWESQGGLCALSGAKLGFIGSGWAAASVDRIDPSKGYIRGNVQWTCWRVNESKSSMGNEDFIAMCRAIAHTCGRCNDYPEREYSQAAGSAQPPL